MSATARPWQVGMYRNRVTLESSLAIWDDTVKEGTAGHPICLVSPEGKRDERDDANADLIVKAVNIHDEAVQMIRNFVGHFIQEGSLAIHPSKKFCKFCGMNSEEKLHSEGCWIEQCEAILVKAEGE